MNTLGLNKGIALDTCVIKKMMDNANYADMLQARIDLRGVDVHICSQVGIEARRKDLDSGVIGAKLEGLGANVIYGQITNRMRAEAKAMEKRRAGLHNGDSEILAYTKEWGLGLLTGDKNLAAATEMEGVDVVNPDQLCGTDNRPKSSYECNAAANARRFNLRGCGPAAPRKRRRRNLPRRARP